MGWILHVDTGCVVVDKPAGLLSVPGRGDDKQDCAWHRVLADIPDALIVHRLDMATSGLLLFARGAELQRAFSMAFERRAVHKRYVALVDGDPGSDQGQIELPLGGRLAEPAAAEGRSAAGQGVDHPLARACSVRLAATPGSNSSRSPAARTSCVCTPPRWAGRSLATRCMAVPALAPPPQRLMLHATALQLASRTGGRCTRAAAHLGAAVLIAAAAHGLEQRRAQAALEVGRRDDLEHRLAAAGIPGRWPGRGRGTANA